ncbi:MAG: hypothetical protein K6A91_02145 [Clostridia bacterium]|nr:hypothetical protein [Clostridia bacterium]
MFSVKKAAALILAAAMVFGLASCGSKAARSTPNNTYELTKEGEAIVTGVDASHAADAGQKEQTDNARVFYEIFVGSFSDSDGDGIGDLKGIINRLDYINDGDAFSGKSLGAEGIWLTPIFKSSSYHKYNVDNYFQVDPQFGTTEDLKTLISECHKRGIKLILDLVINHTGDKNLWFQLFKEAHKNGEVYDPYYEFYSYYLQGQGAPAGRHFQPIAGTSLYYECNFDGAMPELNFDNPEVRRSVLDVAKSYLDMGVDGFRFDAAKYVYYGDNDKNVEFWDWYIGELKKIKPDIYTVAEVWDSDSITDRYFKAVNCFDFSMSQASGLIADTAKAGDANRYTAYVDKYLDSVRAKNKDAMIVPFISNHDMDRAAGYLTAASYNMQFAANLYILGPGSPFIYYGEELGMRGSRGGANTDANRRLAMLWGDEDKVADPVGTTYSKDSQITSTVKEQLGQDDSLLTYYKKLLMIRAANPEIANGEYTALKLSGTKVGGFTSTLNGSTVCVLHNPSIAAQTVDLSSVSGAENFKSIAAAIGQGTASLDGSKLTIDGHTSVVLR